jgi:hypothetical protein
VSAVRAELVEPDPVDRLAERLQEHFRAVVKRGYRTPDIESCRELAKCLQNIRNWQFEDDPEIVARAKHGLVPPGRPEVDAIIKFGNGFVRALFDFAPKSKTTLAGCDQSAVESFRHNCDQLLPHMIQVLRFLEETNLAPSPFKSRVLRPPGCLKPGEFKELTGKRVPDTIQIVAFLAMLVWAEANGAGKYPSNEKTAPLCKFVTAAVSEIGLHTTPATVASILQGRRHKNNDIDIGIDEIIIRHKISRALHR